MAAPNPFDEPTRKVMYRVYWVLGILVTATQIAYMVVTGQTPVWLVATLSVYSYLGIAAGLQADRNTAFTGSAKPQVNPDPEPSSEGSE
jgi:hypothetical protein